MDLDIATSSQQPTASNSSNRSNINTASKPRLSCEKCTQRKVKCDKAFPCSNCSRAGVTCIPVERKRLPRGRNRPATGAVEKRRTELDVDVRDRLARLESLVRGLVPDGQQRASGSGGGAGDAHAGSDVASSDTSTPPSQRWGAGTGGSGSGSAGGFQHGVEGYGDAASLAATKASSAGSPAPAMQAGSQFWADLIQETRGLRDILDRASSEDDYRQEQSVDVHSQLLGMIGSSARSASFVENLESVAGPQVHQQLFQIYVHQVDPVFKILHVPSLAAHIVNGERYLSYEKEHPNVEALDYAIYYAATASMAEEQCMSMFGANKPQVTAKYRLACEASLSRVDFVMTEDMTVLQAFVLYLLVTRAQDRSRRVWTMLSLALRIAQSLAIVCERPSLDHVKPFEREMRIRALFSIGLLDMQAALDRASQTMIMAPILLESGFPANTNDSTFSFITEGEIHSTDGFTDISLFILTSRAQYVGRLLNFPAHHDPQAFDWQMRQKYMDIFREKVSMLFRNVSPEIEATPLYWFTKQLSEVLIATMNLFAVRPIRQQSFICPPLQSSSLLKIAVQVIQRTQILVQDPRSAPWRWFEGIFPPWHSLAVALAEVCVCEDTALLENVWPTILLVFDRLAALVADNRTTIWGPMEKLMEQAQEKMKTVFTPQRGCCRPTLAVESMLPSHDQTVMGVLSAEMQAASLMPFEHQVVPESASMGEQNLMALDSFENWPELNWDMSADLAAATPGWSDAASWGNWKTFVNDLTQGNDSMFSFG